jgi:hypothetical protein
VSKNQGVMAGAIVLVGVLLRPLAMLSPSASSSGEGKGIPAARAPIVHGVKAKGEGPWIASCEYWAAARLGQLDSAGDTTLSISLNTDGTRFRSSVAGSIPAETACLGSNSDDPWGLPNTGKGPRPQITAIIATVPDPSREHLALGFDQTIEGLLEAASEQSLVKDVSIRIHLRS